MFIATCFPVAVEAYAAISNIIPQNQSQFTAALVAIDNTNGAVRAVAFGTNPVSLSTRVTASRVLAETLG